MGFPHYLLDYKKVFKQEVIDDFIDSYSKGHTPIPCIKCNQTVKFRDLLQVTQNLNADVLVTGHYVRKVEIDGEIHVYSSEDSTKDQSYFLFATTFNQLKYLRFPLGTFCKSKIRELGRYLGLQVADKPDSQDICFVSGTYRQTISRLRPQLMEKGKIVHVDGSVLGEHNGIVNFTIGQRRGIGISSLIPLYVVAIDADRNEIVVGPQSALFKDRLQIKDLNWLSTQKIPDSGMEVTVKLRSSHAGGKAIIYPENHDKALVILENGYCAISPGQACVIYNGKRMLGGGWIEK